jgi:hypothetical protein
MHNHVLNDYLYCTGGSILVYADPNPIGPQNVFRVRPIQTNTRMHGRMHVLMYILQYLQQRYTVLRGLKENQPLHFTSKTNFN